MTTLLSRFDDWMNPVAIKELRQAVRGKFVTVSLILSLIGQLLTVAVITVIAALNPGERPGGPAAFMALFSVVFTTGMFFVPLYAGLRIAAERSDVNVDLLFITTIRPRTIVFGKVIAVIAIVGLLFSSALPFLMFSYVLRGIDFTTIAVMVLLAMLIVVSQSILALFVGALPTSRPFKILLGLAFSLGTLMVYGPMVAFSARFLQFGNAFWGASEIWLTLVALAVSLVAADAVLLVLTTAIITPAAANRALPIRVMLVIAWLVSFGVAFWMISARPARAPLDVWAIVQLALATLVLLSATSERETWGARVARTIPARPLRRALAFLFYSGGAGGTLWALMLYAATIALYWGAAELANRTGERVLLNVHFFADAALAMLAYAMSAVLLRRTALQRVPAARTWGLAIALFLVLTVLPPIAMVTRDSDAADWPVYVHITTIANPFPTGQRPVEWRLARTIFLAVWAGLVTAANWRWFTAQARAFRGTKNGASEEAIGVADGTPALQ